MDKGGIKLDMRGRCSAGQKVTIISCSPACLLILLFLIRC